MGNYCEKELNIEPANPLPLPAVPTNVIFQKVNSHTVRNQSPLMISIPKTHNINNDPIQKAPNLLKNTDRIDFIKENLSDHSSGRITTLRRQNMLQLHRSKIMLEELQNSLEPDQIELNDKITKILENLNIVYV